MTATALLQLVDPLPDYLVRALRDWHRLAARFDPDRPSAADSASARQAWLRVEDACLRWEREARARLHAQERGGSS